MGNQKQSLLQEVAEQLLTEKKATFLATKYTQLLINAFLKDNGHKPEIVSLKDINDSNQLRGIRDEEKLAMIAREIVLHLAQGDPTAIVQNDSVKGAKYLEWIVKQYTGSEFRMEDMQMLRTDLGKFHDAKVHKRITGKEADIGVYNVDDLYKVVDEIEGRGEDQSKTAGGSRLATIMEDPEKKALFDKKEAIVYYQGRDVLVIVPKTKKASISLGKGTKWCTASSEYSNYHDHYSKDGPLFMVWTGDGKRYQFHFESSQYMDVNDRSVHLVSIVREFPELKQAFDSVAKKKGMIALMANPSEQDLENAVGKDPDQLQYIEKPTKEMILRAVETRPSVLEKLDKTQLTPELQWAAVEREPEALRHIKDIDEKLAIHAIQNSDFALMFISETSQTWNMIKAAVDKDPDDIIWVNDIDLYSKALEYLKSKGIDIDT